MPEVTVNQLEQVVQKIAALEEIKTMDVSAAVENFTGDGTGPAIKQFFGQIDQAAVLGS